MKLSKFIETYSLHDGGLRRIIFTPHKSSCILDIELSAFADVMLEDANGIDGKIQSGSLIIEEIQKFSWSYSLPLQEMSVEDLDFEILSASVDTLSENPDYEVFKLVIEGRIYKPLHMANICIVEIVAKNGRWESE